MKNGAIFAECNLRSPHRVAGAKLDITCIKLIPYS